MGTNGTINFEQLFAALNDQKNKCHDEIIKYEGHISGKNYLEFTTFDDAMNDLNYWRGQLDGILFAMQEMRA